MPDLDKIKMMIDVTTMAQDEAHDRREKKRKEEQLAEDTFKVLTGNRDLRLGDISKEDFQAFEMVRSSGLYNMWSPEALQLTELGRKLYSAVMKFYGELNEQWPDVRNG